MGGVQLFPRFASKLFILRPRNLLGFVRGMRAAEGAKLLDLKLLGVLVLRVEQNFVVFPAFVVAFFALSTPEGKEGSFFGCACHQREKLNARRL